MICNICSSDKGFSNNHQGSLRENLVCKNCKSTSRDRAYIWSLGYALGEEDTPLSNWPEEKSIKLLETSGYRAHPQFLEKKFDYYNPKFADAPPGAWNDPKKYASVENLPYEKDFFDYVISSDVFEHVRRDHIGFENIFNVLKPEGYFVLTVPLSLGMPENEIRIKVGDTEEKDEGIYNKFYHGGKTLVYRLYGLEILHQLNHFGFYSVIIDLQNSEFNISAQPVVLSRKTKPLELERLYKNPNVTIVKNIAQEKV